MEKITPEEFYIFLEKCQQKDAPEAYYNLDIRKNKLKELVPDLGPNLISSILKVGDCYCVDCILYSAWVSGFQVGRYFESSRAEVKEIRKMMEGS